MKKGFTLMELIIVVVIIGILAMIGLPQYFRVAEKGRAAEGISILGEMRAAQLRFAAERGVTATNAQANDLDVAVPTAAQLRFFNAPQLLGPVNPANNNGANAVASIMRNNVQNQGGVTYTLQIQANGIFVCPGNVAQCEAIRPKQN